MSASTLPRQGGRWATGLFIGALLVSLGAAFVIYQQATALPDDPAERVLALSEGTRPRTRTDQYLEQFQSALKDNPDDAQAQAQYGHVLLQKVRETGDPAFYTRAEQAFNQALALAPDDVDALLGLGSLALARHDFAGALDIATRAQAIAPERQAVYGVLADAQIELGQYDAAVESLQRMVDLRPDLASYSRIAYARELHGDTDGAIEMMKMAAGSSANYAENSAWTVVQLGMLYFNQGDIAAAEYEFQRAQSVVPDYLPALAGLARVRAAQGRLDEAIELAAKPVQRLPLAEYVILYGELLAGAGRTEAASQQWELVRALQKLAESNGVITDLEMALFEADHGDPARAVALAEAAYKVRPSIHAEDTLAWSLFRAGRVDEAAPLMERALRLGTRDARFHFHAGMIAEAQGEREKAREHFAEALAINPHFSVLDAPVARDKLTALESTTP